MVAETPITSSHVVDSRSSELEPLWQSILSALQARGFTQDDVFAVHLALEEAFHNAVKHGNRMDPTKKVTIEYVVDCDKVAISLMDEGAGFNPTSVPDPRVGTNLYRPEGRGLLLINSYMHVVEHCGCGNALRMVRYRDRPGPERAARPAT